MTQNDINLSIEHRKLHLDKKSKVEYWLSFLTLMVPILLFAYVLISSALENQNFPYLVIIPLVLFALLLKYQLFATKLEGFKTTLSPAQFQQSNVAAAKLNDWAILENQQYYFSALQSSLSHSEGIRITAILKENKIFLNSMVNPSISSNPLTFGKNKKNKYQLIKQYQLVLKDTNVVELAEQQIVEQEEDFWQESEWSFKHIFKRMIGYALSIPLFILGIWMISQPENQPKSAIYGLMIAATCATYIFYDLKILIKKNKRKKLRNKKE